MERSIRRINFVLPFKSRRPAGGLRIMYEYANRLSDLGYSIHLIYPIEAKFVPYRLPYFLRNILTRLEGFRVYEWFSFRKEVKRSIVKTISDKYLPDADIVIATWWATAMEVGDLSESKGKKINLIQGYENWAGHLDLLHESYNIKGMTDVVVASYLQKLVKSYTSNRVELIPNAVDKEVFYIHNPIKERSLYTVCMVYSIQELKGSDYGLEAFKIVKRNCPDLKVELFGVCPEPKDLPNWITFYRNPKDLNGLYNRNSIFLSTSLNEGMSLTPMEAMFAGCACVLTDIQGHSEYAIEDETCLLYEAKNIEQLADKIELLIRNQTQRIEIAQKGNDFIQRFSWDKAVAKMDNLIKELLES